MGTTVINNQSFLDLAIQLHGNVEQAFALALANGFSVTDQIIPGSLIDPSSNRINDNPEVVQYFEQRKQKIVTAAKMTEELKPKPSGIGDMSLESDFVVS